MGYTDPERIQKFENNKCALVFTDKLYHITKDEADKETGDFNVCSLHSKYSKVKLTAIDFSKGGGKKATVVDFNLDPLRFKSIASNLKRFKSKTCNENTDQKETGTPQETPERLLGLGKYKSITPTAAINKDGEQAIEELKNNLKIFEQNLTGKYGKMNKEKVEQINKAIDAFKEKPKTEETEEKKKKKKKKNLNK